MLRPRPVPVMPLVLARVTLSVALTMCLPATALHAQSAAVPPVQSVPHVIRVDGVFPSSTGLTTAPVERATLAIYAGPSDEAPLWQEEQDLQVDRGGRYVALLGVTSRKGVPLELFSTGDPRWLGITFAHTGGIEQPRMPLTSVPYALRAADAATLGGLPPSAFQLVGGAARPSAGDEADKSTTRLSSLLPLVNSGTANFIGKFTNTVDLGNSVMFENAGRIGIGSTAPLDVLHSRFTNTDGTITGLAVQNLGGTAASYSGMLFYDQNGALGQFQGFNNSTHEYRINNIASGGSINFMLGGTSRFLVRSDGDIELGGALRRAGVLFLHDLGGLSVAVGGTALANGSSSSQNVAVGYGALNTTTGSGNVAVGWAAGASRTSGNFNTYIGAGVGFGAGSESNTIRVGDPANAQRFFAGGIRGVTTGAANAVAVVIDSNGQLGTVNSSRRYKRDIQDMGEASSGLMRLRPVTYRYEQAYADGSSPIDYGLIAEEVEEVYPDLVAHLANGDVETVQYHKINAMLLNEVQKQRRLLDAQQQLLEQLGARLAVLEQGRSARER